jgi:hypothetical protein
LASFLGVVVVRISGGIVHYFFDSRARAETLVKEKLGELRTELDMRIKRTKADQAGLKDLYDRHSEYQRRIEDDANRLKLQNRKLAEKMTAADELLDDLTRVRESTAHGTTQEGRKRREHGKMDKIIARAEALKKEVVSERA